VELVRLGNIVLKFCHRPTSFCSRQREFTFAPDGQFWNEVAGSIGSRQARNAFRMKGQSRGVALLHAKECRPDGIPSKIGELSV